MAKHVINIRDDALRAKALALVTQAPIGYQVTVEEEKRTKDQNRLMWPLLTKISTSKPKGYAIGTPFHWKCRFLDALNIECLTDIGLNGEPYVIGLSSSALSKKKFCELIELIYAFSAQNGIDQQQIDYKWQDAA